MWGIDLEVDRLSVYAFVVARYSGGFVLNFSLYISEVVVSATQQMMELCPFVLSGNTRWRMRNMNFIAIGLVRAFAGNVDELENQRSASYNSTAPWQKVSADNVF